MAIRPKRPPIDLDSGRTVVLTTHSTHDLGICDKLIVLARDGHCAFVGAPEAAVEYFQVGHDDVRTPRGRGDADRMGASLRGGLETI
jgi:ABC-type multidrug transport system ATPase subunit